MSRFYDPMIAKVTVWGPDRETALRRMREALRDTAVLGIETNLAFHLRVLDEPDFLRGEFSTRYIDQHPELVAAYELDDADARAIAAAAALQAATALTRGQASAGGPPEVSAWRRAEWWRGQV